MVASEVGQANTNRLVLRDYDSQVRVSLPGRLHVSVVALIERYKTDSTAMGPAARRDGAYATSVLVDLLKLG